MTKPAHIILFKILGFLLFLILLAISNVMIPYVNRDLYTGIVMFLNANIILLLIITFIGMINELFWNFDFPFNVLAPVTGGALGVYTVMFLYQIWIFLEGYLNLNINIPVDSFYTLIFLFVMVLGYIIILSRHGKTREEWQEKLKGGHREVSNKKHEENVEWQDVEKEFRLIFYNLGRSVNKMFEGDKRETRKKRKRKRR